MRYLLLFALLAWPAVADQVPDAALDDLPPAEVVILGEVHDNPLHHLNQARAISALRPSAIVWEMLTPVQAAAMPAERRDATQVAQALGWDGTGWPDFALYFPIVEAAADARHYGAAVPRPEARRAFSDGAASVFQGDAMRFGLDRPLAAADQAAREAEHFEAHCAAMPAEMMPGLVEAQRLRDAELARQALIALGDTGGPVVVITGSGHARRDWGVPAVLAQAAPEVTVLTVGQLESDPGPGAPWDLWLLTDAVDRADPCAALR